MSLAGSRKVMTCKVSEAQLPELMKRMASGNHVGRFYVASMDLEVVKQLQQANRIEANNTASHDAGMRAAIA